MRVGILYGLTAKIVKCGDAVQDVYAEGIECSDSSLKLDFKAKVKLVSTNFDPIYFGKTGAY